MQAAVYSQKTDLSSTVYMKSNLTGNTDLPLNILDYQF